MSDLERLDEALAGADEMIKGDYGVILLGSSPILTAARAYRDLLANGERVPLAEEKRPWHTNYNTGERCYCALGGDPFDPTGEEE